MRTVSEHRGKILCGRRSIILLLGEQGRREIGDRTRQLITYAVLEPELAGTGMITVGEGWFYLDQVMRFDVSREVVDKIAYWNVTVTLNGGEEILFDRCDIDLKEWLMRACRGEL